jgi:hypothetical protein
MGSLALSIPKCAMENARNIPSSFSSSFSSAAAAPPAAAPLEAAAAPPPDPPDGTEASLLEPSEINYQDISKSLHVNCYMNSLTVLISLPLSSERRVDRRSSSASIPTELRTALISLAEGDELPPSWRRRYAARCFILKVALDAHQ